MDSFLRPFVLDLARFGPPRRNLGETDATYLGRVDARPDKLVIQEVKYKTNADGSINKEASPDVIMRDDIIVFVGPFCADTPMRRKLSKRGATASKMACMCCLLYVSPKSLLPELCLNYSYSNHECWQLLQGKYIEGAQRFGGYLDTDKHNVSKIAGLILTLNNRSVDPAIVAECDVWREMMARRQPILVKFDNPLLSLDHSKARTLGNMAEQGLSRGKTEKCMQKLTGCVGLPMLIRSVLTLPACFAVLT